MIRRNGSGLIKKLVLPASVALASFLLPNHVHAEGQRETSETEQVAETPSQIKKVTRITENEDDNFMMESCDVHNLNKEVNLELCREYDLTPEKETEEPAGNGVNLSAGGIFLDGGIGGYVKATTYLADRLTVGGRVGLYHMVRGNDTSVPVDDKGKRKTYGEKTAVSGHFDLGYDVLSSPSSSAIRRINLFAGAGVEQVFPSKRSVDGSSGGPIDVSLTSESKSSSERKSSGDLALSFYGGAGVDLGGFNLETSAGYSINSGIEVSFGAGIPLGK